jgi:chorismate synthase
MSIQAMKVVEIGAAAARSPAREEALDEVFAGASRGNLFLGRHSLPFHRETNRAGGLEGGMTNGEPLVVRAAMKPIPTQADPLRTVTVGNWTPASAHKERGDVCAVPAASVVAEHVCFVLGRLPRKIRVGMQCGYLILIKLSGSICGRCPP